MVRIAMVHRELALLTAAVLIGVTLGIWTSTAADAHSPQVNYSAHIHTEPVNGVCKMRTSGGDGTGYASKARAITENYLSTCGTVAAKANYRGGFVVGVKTTGWVYSSVTAAAIAPSATYLCRGYHWGADSANENWDIYNYHDVHQSHC